MLKTALPRAKLPSIPLDGAFGSALMRLASYTQPTGAGSYLRSNLGGRSAWTTRRSGANSA